MNGRILSGKFAAAGQETGDLLCDQQDEFTPCSQHAASAGCRAASLL